MRIRPVLPRATGIFNWGRLRAGDIPDEGRAMPGELAEGEWGVSVPRDTEGGV